MTIVCNLMTCLTHCKVTSHYVGRIWSVYCKHSYPPTPPPRPWSAENVALSPSAILQAVVEPWLRSSSDQNQTTVLKFISLKARKSESGFWRCSSNPELDVSSCSLLFISVAQISLDYLSLGSTPFWFWKQLKHIGSIWFLYTDRESKNSGEEERQHISMAAATFTLIWEPTLGSS